MRSEAGRKYKISDEEIREKSEERKGKEKKKEKGTERRLMTPYRITHYILQCDTLHVN